MLSKEAIDMMSKNELISLVRKYRTVNKIDIDSLNIKDLKRMVHIMNSTFLIEDEEDDIDI